MPAVLLAMENGIQNGVLANHDRDIKQNGASSSAPAMTASKSNPAAITNGNVILPHHPSKPPKSTDPNRLNDLPDEINHITQGFVPVGMLLSRLCQRSHNELREAIIEMAKIPVAKQLPNGNSVPSSTSGLPDDNSTANLTKKQTILNYAQRQHENWTKALIITHWSRSAGDISKLIDLVNHMWAQNDQFMFVRNTLVDNKESFTFARLPPPDLKTAIQVLSQGKFPVLPEFGFVDPPPLSAKQQLDFLDNLDTLLSMRLNIDDHDKIPFHFRRFQVHDGRVTFAVKGEFEVDLTIADEDFTKQYWFVDFRFLFTPEPRDWTPRAKDFVEARVNDALFNDGLDGCYRMLHEYVLTYKINEYRRQALELQKQKWVGTLGVESLNRATGIQYWVGRYPNGPKSWILLGVAGNRKQSIAAAAATRQGVSTSASAMPNRSTSSIAVRWFRDSIEAKDADITLDPFKVSTDSLLRAVTGLHVEHILSTIHRKLLAKPRFAAREAGMRLNISRSDASESHLSIDLDRENKLVVKIDPITGFFAISPQTKITVSFEQHLNTSNKDPTEEGVTVLEKIRTLHFMEEMRRRGRSVGWNTVGYPVRQDDIKLALNTRETAQYAWFKRDGWESKWYVMLALSLSGDKWYLMELMEKERKGGARLTTDNTIKTHIKLPVSAGHPDLNDAFFSDLVTFVTGIMTHISDLDELHHRKISTRLMPTRNESISPHVKIPAICIRLSALLPDTSHRSKKTWARDFVTIEFRGIHRSSHGSDATSGSRINVIAEARLAVADKSRFNVLKGNVDKDILFNRRHGMFCIRMRSEVGKSVIDTLSSRLCAIERLLNFVEAIRKAGPDVECGSVTLRRIEFTYGDRLSSPAASQRQNPGPPVPPPPTPQLKRWKATLDLSDPQLVKVILENNNPHLRVLDFLTELANSDKHFESLPSVLSRTLSLYSALDKMEDSWTNLTAMGKVRLSILPRSIDIVGFRLQITNAKQPTRPHLLNMEIRLLSRQGQLWWHVRRIVVPDGLPIGAGAGPGAQFSLDFDQLLRVSWERAAIRDPRIKKLLQSCAARPESIENALFALNAVIRMGLGENKPQPHGAQGQGQGQGQPGASLRQLQLQQQQQQQQQQQLLQQLQHQQGQGQGQSQSPSTGGTHGVNQAPVAPMMGGPSGAGGTSGGGMIGISAGGNGNANAPFVVLD